ncbi:hypothetical protein BX600DRAFT_510217 [Xylariales sp. PMI_506]|nr:hypothetical protein BX600DRAFT_510217 [Xylariales sp. PMI_506]
MISIADVKASNAQISKDTVPHTAVFTGGTDGIGKAALTRLVSTKLPIRVYVIGRNSDKHKTFLDGLRRSNEKADIVWLEGQISLLAETRRLCDIIKTRETAIDLLYMSAGFIAGGLRNDTSEGNDLSMSLSYYGRVLLMIELMPLLNASSNNPRIITILAAGNEYSSIHLDDLDFRQPGHYSLVSYSRSIATYTTLCMARLAQENPGVVMIHHYPGGVNTDLFKKRYGDKWFWFLMSAMLSLVGISPEDAAEKVVYMSTSAKYGGRGVPLGAKAHPALNMAKTTKAGTLFLVRDKLQEVQIDEVMAELNKMDAGNIVWRKMLETLAPYTS